jgi:hypothetical protein
MVLLPKKQMSLLHSQTKSSIGKHFISLVMQLKFRSMMLCLCLQNSTCVKISLITSFLVFCYYCHSKIFRASILLNLQKALKVISCKENVADYLYHILRNNITFCSQVKIDLREPIILCREELKKKITWTHIRTK